MYFWFVQICCCIFGFGLILYFKFGVVMMEIYNVFGFSYEDSDLDYYCKVLIKMYWDDLEMLSVIVFIGDFFCVGYFTVVNFQFLFFIVFVKLLEEKKYGGLVVFNCYFIMLFNMCVCIEIEN